MRRSGRILINPRLSSLARQVLTLGQVTRCSSLPSKLAKPWVVGALAAGWTFGAPSARPSPRVLRAAGAQVSGMLAFAIGRQWLSRPSPPTAPQPSVGRLAVILPARNEIATIGKIIAAIPRAELVAAGWRP